MRVFVAGATGVAGRRAVTRLIAAGHAVTGIARSSGKAAQLEAAGATPVAVDLFDPDGLRAAIAGHDAVVNLATHIPAPTQMAQMSSWNENERIRSEASGYLVDAAIAAGASVFVQESLAFLYGEHGDDVIDATTTAWAPSPSSGAMATAEANATRFSERGGRGVVLRFGRFYAPDSDQSRLMVENARRGLALDLGRGDAYAPQIDADDVASAVVAALDAPAGVYDIVDDEPWTRKEQHRALAHAVGRRRLLRAPGWTTPKRASYLAVSQRVSNRHFRDATGWRPSSPNVGVGFEKLAAQLDAGRALSGRSRLMLWILAFSAFGVGVQAAFFPRSFYDDFPMGRGWVAMDGPYNQHLIRDVGALNLALLVVTLGALFLSLRSVARIAALSWLVYSVPHFVYHLRHLSMPMSGGEKVAVVVSLAVTVVAPLIILLPERARSFVGSGGASRAGRAPEAVRHDDLRGDVGVGGRNGRDQSRAGVS
jgi:nucleoside-diphosphate-sugar epimerase